jgi:hypothetical protein
MKSFIGKGKGLVPVAFCFIAFALVRKAVEGHCSNCVGKEKVHDCNSHAAVLCLSHRSPEKTMK